MDKFRENLLDSSRNLWLARIWWRSSRRSILWKKVFLETSQNFQENICIRVCFLIKLQDSDFTLLKFIKKRLYHKYFPVNFTKLPRTLSLQNTNTFGGCFSRCSIAALKLFCNSKEKKDLQNRTFYIKLRTLGCNFTAKCLHEKWSM